MCTSISSNSHTSTTATSATATATAATAVRRMAQNVCSTTLANTSRCWVQPRACEWAGKPAAVTLNVILAIAANATITSTIVVAPADLGGPACGAGGTTGAWPGLRDV
jgi:hypothetical protein